MLNFGKVECENIGPDTFGCVLKSLAFVSLLLTLINIVCIFVIGCITLWLKKVTPDRVPQNCSKFWRNDIKKHRSLEGKEITRNSFQQIIEDEARHKLEIRGSENQDQIDMFTQAAIEKIKQDGDLRRISNPRTPFILSNEENPFQHFPSKPSILSYIDTQFYHQAELLIKRSEDNCGFRPVSVRVPDTSENEGNMNGFSTTT